MSGEDLARDAEQARQQLRDAERTVQESEFAERVLQTRIADLARNQQLAQDQIQRAETELNGLQGELFELDETASQTGLQAAPEERAGHEERLSQARLALENLANGRASSRERGWQDVYKSEVTETIKNKKTNS